jgi:hypothetical protein
MNNSWRGIFIESINFNIFQDLITFMPMLRGIQCEKYCFPIIKIKQFHPLNIDYNLPKIEV